MRETAKIDPGVVVGLGIRHLGPLDQCQTVAHAARLVGLVRLGDHQIDHRRDLEGAARRLARGRRMEDGHVDRDVGCGLAQRPVERDRRQPVAPRGRRARPGDEDVQRLEARPPKTGRQRPRQAPGVGQVQPLEVREAAQGGRDRAGQVVAPEGQPPEAGQIPQPRRDRAGQRVPAEIQPFEVRQAAQGGRDRAAQVVPPQRQPAQAGQAPQPRRKRAGQRVPAELQLLQVRQASQGGRDRAAQVVPPERQPAQAGQVPQPCRDRTGQRVPAELQLLQVCQTSQVARDRAGQSVLREGQPPEVRQAAQLAGDRTAQRVPVEVQLLEAGQASQRSGDGTGQAVVVETQPRDPARGAGRHPVPLAQRRRRLPARAVRPVGAAGRVVERLERLAVALRTGRRGGRHGYLLGGAQAVRIARGHRHRRRPRRPRHEPDGVAGYEDADRAGGAGRGRVGQRIVVGVAETGLHGHAGGGPRLGQRLGRDRADGLAAPLVTRPFIRCPPGGDPALRMSRASHS